MNDPDNFLSRWSRRKQEAGEDKEKNETGEAVAAPAPETQQGKPAAPSAAPIPEFDVESLPSIESISAGTDISAFMRSGVPEGLKHAALRRAWSSDPVIRDFVGLNENYWDVAGPDGIAGFGDIGQYGQEGMRFWTKTKVVTQRWPDGFVDAGDKGAFHIPTFG